MLTRKASATTTTCQTDRTLPLVTFKNSLRAWRDRQKGQDRTSEPAQEKTNNRLAHD
jgi:hypothetical protein